MFMHQHCRMCIEPTAGKALCIQCMRFRTEQITLERGEANAMASNNIGSMIDWPRCTLLYLVPVPEANGTGAELTFGAQSAKGGEDSRVPAWAMEADQLFPENLRLSLAQAAVLSCCETLLSARSCHLSLGLSLRPTLLYYNTRLYHCAILTATSRKKASPRSSHTHG